MTSVTNNLRTDRTGAYNRHDAKHRHTKGDPVPCENGRYHLHVALACPWAAGALAVVYLKGLEGVVSHSIVHPTWGKTKPDDDADKHHGWVYRKPGDAPMTSPTGNGSFECDAALVPDMVTNVATVREVFELNGDTTGPFTTPLLWDNKDKRIVSNESTEILRIFNSEWNDLAGNPGLDLYPAEHEAAMVELNDRLVYPRVNNGVYRCGFARSQESYELAVGEVFGALDELDERLGKTRFLSGDTFTWLDLRLFKTLVRFDPVYTVYFKCTTKRIADYPNLLAFVRDVYSIEPIARAVNMTHIKMHYYTSHPHLNTFAIIPVGNGADLTVPHGRGPPLAELNVMARVGGGEGKE